MSFLAELRARLERAKAHVEALERVLELEQGIEGQAAQMPNDAEARRIPARARVPRQAAQARSSAQPVETGKGTPPSAPRSSASGKHTRQPKHDEIPRGKKWCSHHEELHDVSEFGLNNRTPDKLMRYCRAANAAVQRRSREAMARREGRKLRRSPKPKNEEAEPVRAAALNEKRCARCNVVKDREDFIGDTGVEHATCNRCKQLVRDRGENVGELHKAEHAARIERIARRVAARKNRRHGRKQDGAGNGPFMRCLFQRAPQTVGDTVLTLHSVACGAVVIAGDEADHLDDVHGLAGSEVAQLFEPIPSAGGGMTRTSGSGRGSEGRP